MDIIDRVYIASAIDGEGWISLLKSKGSRCLLGYRFKPEVGISNTNEEFVRYIYSKVQSGCFRVRKDKRKNRKRIFALHINKANDIVALLSEIKEYLKIKQKQAELLIEFCKRHDGYRGKGKWIHLNERDHEIYGELKRVNEKSSKVAERFKPKTSEKGERVSSSPSKKVVK